jgi:SAM-dependent methyltransferase
MSSPQEWDERFLGDSHGGPTPDPFLSVSRKYWGLAPARDGTPRSKPKALDLACGAGRHAVALSAAGFEVTAVDFSREGLRKGSELARRDGVTVDWVERDLEAADADLGVALYDLAAVFFYLHRPLFPVLERCLKPGGLLVYKTYSVDQLRHSGGPHQRAYLLEHNELLRAFAAFRVLVYEEEWEGKGTASLIAQRL